MEGSFLTTAAPTEKGQPLLRPIAGGSAALTRRVQLITRETVAVEHAGFPRHSNDVYGMTVDYTVRSGSAPLLVYAAIKA
jgi:hypothetical protein